MVRAFSEFLIIFSKQLGMAPRIVRFVNHQAKNNKKTFKSSIS